MYTRCWDLGSPAFAIRPESLRISHASTFAVSARRSFSQNAALRSNETSVAISQNISRSRSTNFQLFPFRSDVAISSAKSFPISFAAHLALGLSGCKSLHRPQSPSIVQLTWQRGIHTSGRKRSRGSRRYKSSITNDQNGKRTSSSQKDAKSSSTPPPELKDSAPEDASSYMHLPHLPHLPHIPHMPKIPHRPTKEELLAAANGFFSRLKVRFKWLTIRNTRPYNVDDWSAFISWFVMGNLIWIFVGTTTFFSLVIYTINTVVAQGTYFVVFLLTI